MLDELFAVRFLVPVENLSGAVIVFLTFLPELCESHVFAVACPNVPNWPSFSPNKSAPI